MTGGQNGGLSSPYGIGLRDAVWLVNAKLLRAVSKRPTAPDVKLSLGGKHEVAQGPDGVWSVTLSPIDPEIYESSLNIDAATVQDASTARSVKAREVYVHIVGPNLQPSRRPVVWM